MCKVLDLPLRANYVYLHTKLLLLYNQKYFSDEVFQFQYLPVQGLLLYFRFLGSYISVPYPAICTTTDNNETQPSFMPDCCTVVSSKPPVNLFCEYVALQASQTAVPKINFKIFTNK